MPIGWVVMAAFALLLVVGLATLIVVKEWADA